MSVRERQRPPIGHGEVFCDPPYAEWPVLASANAESVGSWPDELRALRDTARAEAVGMAQDYGRGIGVESRRAAGDLIVMTGHQPTLYHPGVWAKDFLVQRFTEDVASLGIDLVVDTDAAGAVELVAPCLSPDVSVCRVPLAEPPDGAAFVQTPVPDSAARAAFREGGARALATVAAPALGHHFASFCDALDGVADSCDDLGMVMTAARRVYEQPAGTDYLELPVSMQSSGDAFCSFAASIIADARSFALAYNAALSEYRTLTGTRSPAQPFPDLAVGPDLTEVPFWLLAGGVRRALAVDRRGRLMAGETLVAEEGDGWVPALRALAAQGTAVAPKAITLTLFARMFVADLFVHGIGGGRYDRVTDGVIGRYFGVTPPRFAVASLTLMLPIGCQVTGDAEVAAYEERLHRLTHNPDQVLGEIEFDTRDERARADALAREKRELVGAITAPGADRKALGLRIREVNAGLVGLLEPLVAQTRVELQRARSARDASAVLTDRTYPYCLWDPREVADKVR